MQVVSSCVGISPSCVLASCIVSSALFLMIAGCRDSEPTSTVPAGDSDQGQKPAPMSTSVHSDSAPAGLHVVLRLTDAAAESNLDFAYFNDPVPNRYFLPEIMGGGVGWIDYDLDGWQDLYLSNGCRLEPNGATDTEHINGLFRNDRNGGFEDTTRPSRAGGSGFGQGVAIGDYNADGFPDVYVANYGPNILLRNNGDGTFEDVTEQAGVGDDKWGSSVAWSDLDGDGTLDLYVTNFLNVDFSNHKVCDYSGQPGYCGPGTYGGVPDRVYLNQANGTFVESAEKLAFTEPNGKGLTLAIMDFNDDLVPEVYVCNDMTPNFLYTRKQETKEPGEPSSQTPASVTYENVGLAAGCAASDEGLFEASMGVACADFDGDGHVDIFLTHFHAAKNTLYRNYGNLIFADESRRSRIAATSFNLLAFGTVAFDYDRDGALDLFCANGHVLGPNFDPCDMRPQFLRNDGRARFDDITDAVEGTYFREKWLGRGAAGGDYDNDGDLDIVVTHLNRPVALLRNDTETGGHFLGIQLSTPSRIPPVGGRVIVDFAEREMIVPIVAGGSYHSSGDPRLLVGLWDTDQDVRVTVYWPSGRVDSYTQLEVDRYWHIIEGSTPILAAGNHRLE